MNWGRAGRGGGTKDHTRDGLYLYQRITEKWGGVGKVSAERCVLNTRLESRHTVRLAFTDSNWSGRLAPERVQQKDTTKLGAMGMLYSKMPK